MNEKTEDAVVDSLISAMYLLELLFDEDEFGNYKKSKYSADFNEMVEAAHEYVQFAYSLVMSEEIDPNKRMSKETMELMARISTNSAIEDAKNPPLYPGE